MNRILLLIDDAELHQQLLAMLQDVYQLVVPDAAAGPGTPADATQADLCITDPAALARQGERLRHYKYANLPVYFPVLLVLASDRIADHNGRFPDPVIDDVLLTPVNPTVLELRINTQLYTRQLSVQLQVSQNIITRTSKAIESTSDAISIADIHGTAMYHNQAFLDLYGYSVHELNVSGILNTLFVDSRTAQTIFHTIKQGHTWSGEVDLRTKAGAIVPTLLRADSIEDDAGNQVGLISVYTDITARKREEAAQHERRIMDEALRDTAAALTSTLDLDEVLERILANVGRVVPHDAANIMLVEGANARIVRWHGYDDIPLADLTVAIDDAEVLRRMMTTGQPITIDDTRDTPGWTDILNVPSLRSYAGSPIHLKAHVIGFLNLGSLRANFYQPIHAMRLQVFAEQAAIGIQNAQLHEKAQTLAVLEERQRLARDLHDAVSQTLFSANVIAEALPRLWARDPEIVHQRLEQLHRLTRGALAEMRTLLMELRPTALLEAELDDLLRLLTDAVTGRTHIHIDLTMDDLPVSLPADVKVALYYIVQEALHNVVKHARANRATVHLQAKPGGLRVEVTDDGRGFDITQVPATSLGLLILQERSRDIAASLDIDSTPGSGTTIAVEWTAQPEKESDE